MSLNRSKRFQEVEPWKNYQDIFKSNVDLENARLVEKMNLIKQSKYKQGIPDKKAIERFDKKNKEFMINHAVGHAKSQHYLKTKLNLDNNSLYNRINKAKTKLQQNTLEMLKDYETHQKKVKHMMRYPVVKNQKQVATNYNNSVFDPLPQQNRPRSVSEMKSGFQLRSTLNNIKSEIENINTQKSRQQFYENILLYTENQIGLNTRDRLMTQQNNKENFSNLYYKDEINFQDQQMEDSSNTKNKQTRNTDNYDETTSYQMLSTIKNQQNSTIVPQKNDQENGVDFISLMNRRPNFKEVIQNIPKKLPSLKSHVIIKNNTQVYSPQKNDKKNYKMQVARQMMKTLQKPNINNQQSLSKISSQHKILKKQLSNTQFMINQQQNSQNYDSNHTDSLVQMYNQTKYDDSQYNCNQNQNQNKNFNFNQTSFSSQLQKANDNFQNNKTQITTNSNQNNFKQGAFFDQNQQGSLLKLKSINFQQENQNDNNKDVQININNKTNEDFIQINNDDIQQQQYQQNKYAINASQQLLSKENLISQTEDTYQVSASEEDSKIQSFNQQSFGKASKLNHSQAQIQGSNSQSNIRKRPKVATQNIINKIEEQDENNSNIYQAQIKNKKKQNEQFISEQNNIDLVKRLKSEQSQKLQEQNKKIPMHSNSNQKKSISPEKREKITVTYKPEQYDF